MLGIEAEALSADELVQAVLKAPVDLLWNGGIGTYVRASHETDADAAERTKRWWRERLAALTVSLEGGAADA